MSARRWLRFSLRTLFLVSALAGSLGLLWRAWPAWGLALELEEPGPIHEIHISPDDSYFCVCIAVKDASGWKSEIRQRELPGGRLIRTFPGDKFYWHAFLCYTGKYIGQWSYEPRTPDVSALYRADTGEKLPLSETVKSAFYVGAMPCSDNYIAAMTSDTQGVLLQLPSCRKMMQFNTGAPSISDNDQWLAMKSGPAVKLIALPGMESGPVYQFPGEIGLMEFSHDGKWLAVEYKIGGKNSTEERVDPHSKESYSTVTRLIDVARGTSQEYPGEMRGSHETFSPSGKWLKTHSEKRTYLWNLEAGSEPVIIEDPTAYYFSKDEKRIHTNDMGRVWDTRTGQKLWEDNSFCTYSPDSEYVALKKAGKPVKIAKGASGESVFELQELDETTGNLRIKNVEFAHARPLFISLSEPSAFKDEEPETWLRKWKLWQRWRPEAWWGIAWRLEFWLAVGMCGAVVWSWRRDLRDPLHDPSTLNAA